MTHPFDHDPKQQTLLRNPVVRTGLITGVLLSLIMAIALIAANRILQFEPFALERNAICFGLFTLAALTPIVRFRSSPGQQFTSGMIGWAVLTMAYVADGNYFHNLYTALRTPGVVLAYGAALYGMIAIICWVASMIQSGAHHRPAPARRRARDILHHPR